MSNQISVFDSLKADVAVFVSPIKSVAVADFKGSQDAIEAAKRVKEYRKQIDEIRDGLVRPLNEQVKIINAYAKGIDAPLIEAEAHLRAQLNAFAAEQEKARQAELQRLEAERREAERVAREDRRRQEEELAAAQAYEREVQAQATDMFGAGDEPEESIEAKQTREMLEHQAELDRQDALRKVEAQQRAWDANQQQIKGTKQLWKCEVENIDLVPKEYLIRTLNDKMVLAAARGGVTSIPGVRLWQETSVSIGSKTYVPRTALK